MSKGSKQRPGDKAKFDGGYDRIFGPKKRNRVFYECPVNLLEFVYFSDQVNDHVAK